MAVDVATEEVDAIRAHSESETDVRLARASV
jgi:hypothetical protein